jgi:hypothetical protein
MADSISFRKSQHFATFGALRACSHQISIGIMNIAHPEVVFTLSLFGRSLKKENPVPPPDLCMRSVFFKNSQSIFFQINIFI